MRNTQMTESTMANDQELWIRECLIRTVLEKQQTLIPAKKINLISSAIKKFVNDGGYIITECYNVNIVLDADGGAKTISIFVKATPNVPDQDYDMFDFAHKFKNEIIAYADILPSLGSPEDFPTFYHSKLERASAAIAISDFLADGFSMSKSRVNLSLDHILAAMKALGKFHGASFALKHNDRTRFDELRNKLCKSGLHNRLHPIHEATMRNGQRRALKHFRESDDVAKVPDVFLQKLEQVFVEDDNMYEYMSSRANPVEPLSIICHGDFLRNNIAFAYDSDGMATKAMLFDFQTVVYTSPMLDLCLFMANSTGHETRKKHFEEIFRTYYDEVIAHFLNGTGLNADDLPDYMRYDEFLREYAIQMPYGYLIGAYFTAMLLESCDFLNTFERLPSLIWTLGGDVADRETQAQILEMYELHKKFNLKLLDDA